jgi:hypothetical protein
MNTEKFGLSERQGSGDISLQKIKNRIKLAPWRMLHFREPKLSCSLRRFKGHGQKAREKISRVTY